MSVTNAMPKEIGTIGQKYENRRNKKTGILEERDEKHKQLIFKADNGSSFIVMYSTFRSDWRKVNDGESEIKITPKVSKSEKRPTVTKESPVVTENKKSRTKKSERVLTDKEHQELRMQAMDAIIEALESAGLNYNVKVTSKSKGIMVKNGKPRKMEVYVVNKDTVFYSIYFGCTVDLPKTYGATYDYFEGYKLPHRYRMKDLHLKEFIKILKAENTNKEEK